VRDGCFWCVFDDPSEIYNFRPLRTMEDMKEIVVFFANYEIKSKKVPTAEGPLSLKKVAEKFDDEYTTAKINNPGYKEDELVFLAILTISAACEGTFSGVEAVLTLDTWRDGCGMTGFEAACIILYTAQSVVFEFVNRSLARHKRGSIRKIMRFIGTLSLGIRKLQYLPCETKMTSLRHFVRTDVIPFTGTRMIVPTVYSTTMQFTVPASLDKDVQDENPDVISPPAKSAFVRKFMTRFCKDEMEVLFEPGTAFTCASTILGFSLTEDRLFFLDPPEKQTSLFLPFGIDYYRKESPSVFKPQKEIACLHFLHATGWNVVEKMANELTTSKWTDIIKFARPEITTDSDKKGLPDALEKLSGEKSDEKKIVFEVLSFLEEDFGNEALQCRFLVCLYYWIHHFNLIQTKYPDVLPDKLRAVKIHLPPS